jgi:hypothetical protein
LQSADLTGAQFQGADLTGAHLQGAVLKYAQLQGADLTGVQLQGADLLGAGLWNVRADQTTEMSLVVLQDISFDKISDVEQATLFSLMPRWLLERVQKALEPREDVMRLPSVATSKGQILADSPIPEALAGLSDQQTTTDAAAYYPMLASYLASEVATLSSLVARRVALRALESPVDAEQQSFNASLAACLIEKMGSDAVKLSQETEARLRVIATTC